MTGRRSTRERIDPDYFPRDDETLVQFERRMRARERREKCDRKRQKQKGEDPFDVSW